MPTDRKCAFCGNIIPLSLSLCPHCGRPSLPPNVEMASSPEERDALSRRYEEVIKDAETRGCFDVVQRFKDEVSRSKAVIARSTLETMRLANSDKEIYVTYYTLVDAGIRLISGSKWDVLRSVADDALFPGFKKDIRFAALSLDGRGLFNYGECAIVLREDMIAHRTTVFEENSVMFMHRQNVRMDQANSLPLGHRATWTERDKLCVAKKGNELRENTDFSQFAELILKQGATSEDDDFIEVHIWGPMTRLTFKRIVVNSKKITKKADRARLRALQETVADVGIIMEDD